MEEEVLVGGFLEKSITLENFLMGTSGKAKASLMLLYVDDERKLKYVSDK